MQSSTHARKCHGTTLQRLGCRLLISSIWTAWCAPVWVLWLLQPLLGSRKCRLQPLEIHGARKPHMVLAGPLLGQYHPKLKPLMKAKPFPQSLTSR